MNSLNNKPLEEMKQPFSQDIRKSMDDWFRCIGVALAEKDFFGLMEKAGFKKIKVIPLIRNARTGHELAVCANVRA